VKGFIRASLVLPAILAFASCVMRAPTITAPRYALVYGVQNYLNGALQFADNDARAMKSILAAQGWSFAIVPEREDSSVTKDQLKNDILSLSSVPSDSTVLVYFSGHGTDADLWNPRDPAYSGPYIVPYDAISLTGLTEPTELVSPAELQGWLAQIGTKNVIVILDCCYSGGFVSSSGATDASPKNYSSTALYSAFATAMCNFSGLLVANASASGAKTPIVISAAGPSDKSIEDDALSHGVFTYFLLKAATQGDSDGDGVVTTTEAYAYASAHIKEWDSSLTYYDEYDKDIWPFLPHISGDTRDLVLFTD
jgi:hypothetical protein